MKKKFRNIITALLVFAMAMSLAACGNSGSEGAKTDKKDEVTPEFVYTSTYKTVSKGSDWINPTQYTDDGFFCVINDVIGQRELNEGETLEYEGQLNIYGQKLLFYSYDGSKSELPNYSEMKTESGHDCSSGINTIARDKDGNIVTVCNLYESWNDAPDGVDPYGEEWYQYYKYEEGYYIRVLDATGAEISCAQLTTPSDCEYFYPYNCRVVENKIAVSTDGGVYIFDLDGNYCGAIKTNLYPESFVTLRDGRNCFTAYDGEKGGYALCVYDVDTLSVTETLKAPDNAWNCMPGSGDYDFYYTNGSNFYGYNAQTETEEKLFNWINVDVDPNNMSSMPYVLPDGRVFCVVNTWDSSYMNCTTDFVYVEKKPYDSVPHKSTITLAGQYIDYDLVSTIIKFNRDSDVRIEVKDYSEYNTEEDWNAGLTKLTTEIMAGTVPDIISLNGLPYKQMAVKGLLEDLYPYIDNDSELSRDDFFPNILAAKESNGKLCSTVSFFNISTLSGSSSVVGDEPGWTYAEFNEALANMPEGCTALTPYTTSGDILRTGVTLDMDRYVNWATGECHFDSQEFIDLLRFADTFPDTFDWNSYEWEDEAQLVSQGLRMLIETYISGFDVNYYDHMFGGESTYIGYPSTTGAGTGAYISFYNGNYGLSSSCKEKEAAWKFLRTFFTEKYQTDLWYYGLPCNKAVFNAKLEEEMTPQYVTDVDGNFVLDENGEKVQMSRGGWGDEFGNFYEYYAMTQEQADAITYLVENTTSVYEENNSIMEMVYAQADAFFAGQKSAEEVAKLVQNQVSLYVNEQK